MRAESSFKWYLPGSLIAHAALRDGFILRPKEPSSPPDEVWSAGGFGKMAAFPKSVQKAAAAFRKSVRRFKPDTIPDNEREKIFVKTAGSFGAGQWQETVAVAMYARCKARLLVQVFVASVARTRHHGNV
jgi:hypothetical protein